MSEKISQLIDRDLSPGQCEDQIEKLCAGDGCTSTWQNYHLIGNVIRGEIVSAETDLSARISAALDDEPIVLAPRALEKDDKPAHDIWKPVSMFALAASLALVAVVTLNPGDQKSVRDPLVSIDRPSENTEQEKFAQEFGEMLVEHGEFTASASLNGLVAYAKLVSNQQIDR